MIVSLILARMTVRHLRKVGKPRPRGTEATHLVSEAGSSLVPRFLEITSRIIETTIGFNRHPTYDDLKGMKILSNMVSETLRLYPGIPFNTRACAKDTSLPCGGGEEGNDPIGVLAGNNIILANHMLP